MTKSISKPVMAATLATLITAVIAIPLSGYAGFYLGATVRVSSLFEQRLAEFTDAYAFRQRADAASAEDLVETIDLRLGYAVLELRRYWPYLEEPQRTQADRFLQQVREEAIFEGDESTLAREVREALRQLAPGDVVANSS